MADDHANGKADETEKPAQEPRRTTTRRRTPGARAEAETQSKREEDADAGGSDEETDSSVTADQESGASGDKQHLPATAKTAKSGEETNKGTHEDTPKKEEPKPTSLAEILRFHRKIRKGRR
jgi:hypothetical protein